MTETKTKQHLRETVAVTLEAYREQRLARAETYLSTGERDLWPVHQDKEKFQDYSSAVRVLVNHVLTSEKNKRGEYVCPALGWTVEEWAWTNGYDKDPFNFYFELVGVAEVKTGMEWRESKTVRMRVPMDFYPDRGLDQELDRLKAHAALVVQAKADMEQAALRRVVKTANEAGTL